MYIIHWTIVNLLFDLILNVVIVGIKNIVIQYFYHLLYYCDNYRIMIKSLW